MFATGGTKQVKPVQELTNTKGYEIYAGAMIDSMFGHHILLKVFKRLSAEEGEQKRSKIKNYIYI